MLVFGPCVIAFCLLLAVILADFVFYRCDFCYYQGLVPTSFRPKLSLKEDHEMFLIDAQTKSSLNVKSISRVFLYFLIISVICARVSLFILSISLLSDCMLTLIRHN